MLRADAGTPADAPDHGTEGPAVSRSPASSPRARQVRPRTRPHPRPPWPGPVLPQGPGRPATGPRRQGGNSNPVRHRPGTHGRQQACSGGKAGIQACSAQRGNQGLQPGPEHPGAHDQSRAGGKSASGQLAAPAGCRETPSRVWSLTSATEGLDEASAVAGGPSDRGLKADSPRVHVDVEVHGELTLGQTVFRVAARGAQTAHRRRRVRPDGRKSVKLLMDTFAPRRLAHTARCSGG